MISSAYLTSSMVKRARWCRITTRQLASLQPQGKMHQRRTCLGKFMTVQLAMRSMMKRRPSNNKSMLPVPALMKNYRVKTRALASSLRPRTAKSTKSQGNMKRTTVRIAAPVMQLTSRGQMKAKARFRKSTNGH